jgi:hypothetical protein
MGAIGGLLVFIGTLCPCAAMDHGWPKDDKKTQWMEAQKIPPEYAVSCCGKGEAYFVDRYEVLPNGDHRVWVDHGESVTFPDGTVRPYLSPEPFIVPADSVNKPEDDLDNPFDHSIVFLQVTDGRPSVAADGSLTIYCFIRHPNLN